MAWEVCVGTRGGGRTHNLRLRRPTLYPIELLAHAMVNGILHPAPQDRGVRRGFPLTTWAASYVPSEGCGKQIYRTPWGFEMTTLVVPAASAALIWSRRANVPRRCTLPSGNAR